MSTNLSQDEYKKLFEEALGSIDTLTYILSLYGKRIQKVSQNLVELPDSQNIHDVLKLLSNAGSSLRLLNRVPRNLIPRTDVNKEELSLEFLNAHSVFIAYHWDSMVLLEHALVSAFTGFYTAARIEMRSALEDAVEGAIFNLLTIPKYRKNAEELRKIKGFGSNAVGFKELINLLDEEFKDTRPDISMSIFDKIDKKLKRFNPEAKFHKMLLQLKCWELISTEAFCKISELYSNLSKYVHRTHIRFSEVGKRIEVGKDWLELEPVPEVLCECLKNFIDLCGWILYITIKEFSVDLVDPKEYRYKNNLNIKELRKLIKSAKDLSKGYVSWKAVINEVENIIKQ